MSTLLDLGNMSDCNRSLSQSDALSFVFPEEELGSSVSAAQQASKWSAEQLVWVQKLVTSSLMSGRGSERRRQKASRRSTLRPANRAERRRMVNEAASGKLGARIEERRTVKLNRRRNAVAVSGDVSGEGGSAGSRQNVSRQTTASSTDGIEFSCGDYDLRPVVASGSTALQAYAALKTGGMDAQVYVGMPHL